MEPTEFARAVPTYDLGTVHYSRYVVGGVRLGNGWLFPLIVYPKYRSKYVPHQGMRECIRRIRQAFKSGELVFDVVV